MKQRLINLSRNAKTNISNTKKRTDSANRHLSEGTMSVTWDKISNIVAKKESVDQLG